MKTDSVNGDIVADLQKLSLGADSDRWRREIEMINLEVIFYRNLVKSHHQEFTVWSASDYQSLFTGLRDVQFYNESFQKRHQEFVKRIESLAPCSEAACTEKLLADYLSFKREIEDHFTRYKDFKKSLFLYLKTRYNY